MKRWLSKRNRIAVFALALVMSAGLALYAGQSVAYAAEEEPSVSPAAENAVEASDWETLARALINGQNVRMTGDISADTVVGFGSTVSGTSAGRRYVIVGRNASSADEIVLDLNGYTLDMGSCYFVMDPGKTLTVNGGGSGAPGNVSYEDENGKTVFCPSYGQIVNAAYTAIEITGANAVVNLNHVIFKGNGLGTDDYYRAAIIGGALYDGSPLNGDITVNTDDCYFVDNAASIRFVKMTCTVQGYTDGRQKILTGKINVKDSVFSGGDSVCGGGAIYAENTVLTVENSAFLNNSAVKGGGAIYGTSNGEMATQITLKDCRFKGNETSEGSGGAIYTTNNTKVTVEGGSFKENTSLGGGGAVCVYTGTLHITGADFLANNSYYNGGAVYVTNGSQATVEDSRFDANYASTGHGGAIYATNSSPVTLDGCTFEGNYVPMADGGAIYASNGSAVNATDSKFAENKAPSSNGGAIYAYSGATTTLEGCTFEGNTSYGSGGALYFYGGTVTLKDTDFSSNETRYQGGAAYISGYTLTVTGGTYEGNTVLYGNGGAFYLDSGTPTFTDVDFFSNRSNYSGGAIYAQYFTMTLNGGLFKSNLSTYGSGGAVALQSGSLTMEDAEFDSNNAIARGKGGAVYLSSGSIVMNGRSSMHGNRGRDGGAVYVESGALTMNGESSIYNNNAIAEEVYNWSDGPRTSYYGRGGAVFLENHATLIMNGASSLYGNQSTEGGAVNARQYSTVVMYNETSMYGNATKYQNGPGGAVKLLSASTLVMNDRSSLYHNSAYSTGGAVDAGTNSSYDLQDCSIIMNGESSIYENTAAKEGGGIYLMIQCTLRMNDHTSLLRNKATRAGGGVAAHGDDTIVINGSVRINGNTGAQGGGIYCKDRSTLTVTGGEICNNTADGTPGSLGNTGGGIFAYYLSADLVLKDVKIDGNKTIGDPNHGGNTAANGGGIFCYAPSYNLVMENCTVSGNTAEGFGGGIFAACTRDILLTNVTVDGNTSNGKGGGICVVNNYGDLTIRGKSSVSGNTAWNDEPSGSYGQDVSGEGGGLFLHDISATLEGVRIDGNTASSRGGGIWMYAGSDSLTLKDVSVSRNRSGEGPFHSSNYGVNTGSGGGLFLSVSSVAIDGSSIDGNTSRFNGGGIYINGGSKYNSSDRTESNYVLSITDTSVSGNEATGAASSDGTFDGGLGGGIYFYSTMDATLKDLRINGNKSASDGGGVYMNDNSSALEFKDSTFSGNRADGNGGAILVASSSVTLSGDTTVSGNTAQYHGGGIAYGQRYSAKIVAKGVSFTGNTALTGNGGAIFAMNGSSVTATDSRFEGNTAAKGTGGAIYANGGTPVTVTGSQFVRNNAPYNFGGAIYAYNGSSIAAEDSSFENNYSYAGGGAVYFYGGTLTFTDTDFTSNTSTYAGGAVNASGYTMTLTGGLFKTNVASSSDGGALCLSSGTLTVNDAEFDGNHAGYKGGAISVSSGSVSLNGETGLYKNTSYEGGAVFVGSAAMVNGTASLTMNDDSTMYDNHTTSSGSGSGGAVRVAFRSTLVMNDRTSLHDNTAYSGGAVQAGAFYNDENDGYCTVVMYGESSMYSNHTTSRSSGGGAITVIKGSTLVMNDQSSLHDNTALGDGGAVRAGLSGNEASAIIMNDTASIYQNEVAYGNGGGISLNYGDSLTMNGASSIHHNRAYTPGGVRSFSGPVGGGVSAIYGGPITLNGSEEQMPSISYNEAEHGGAVFMRYAAYGKGPASLTVNYGEFIGNVGTGGSGGGAIHSNYSGDVILKHATLEHNMTQGVYSESSAYATHGGAIYFTSYNRSEYSLLIEDSVIRYNEAGMSGGAIALYSGDALLHNVIVEHNTANAGNGGGIAMMSSGDLTITGDSSVSFNKAIGDVFDTGSFGVVRMQYRGGNGGGISAPYVGAITLEGTRIEGNEAENNGGGLMIFGNTYGESKITLHEITVINNKAGLVSGTEKFFDPVYESKPLTPGKGGGLFLMSGNMTITDSIVEGNETNGVGGGICAFNHNSLTITGTSLKGNLVNEFMIPSSGGEEEWTVGGGYGAGLYLNGVSSVTLEGVEIDGNESENDGGGVFITHSAGNVDFTDVSINNNTSGTNGGGMVIGGANNVTLTDISVSGNTAAFSGGGIYLSGDEYVNTNFDGTTYVTLYAGGLTVDGGEICGNTALNGNGGGICSEGLTIPGYINRLTLKNGAKVDGNKAEECLTNGGGVYAYYTNVNTETGVSISDNFAKGMGGGLYADLGANLNMDATAVKGNKADYAGGGICAVTRTDPIIPELGKDCAEGQTGSNTVSITDSAIENNTATGETWAYPESPVELGNGGGIYLSEGYASVYLKDLTVQNNSAARNGGGICYVNASNNAHALILGGKSTLVGNTAGRKDGGKVDDNRPEVQREYGNGGALYLEGITLTIDDGLTVRNNTALAEGGGIYATRHFVDGAGADPEVGGWYTHAKDYFTQSVITMNGGKITGNLAKGQGVRVLENSDNDWGYGGGGVSVKSSSFVMNGGEISDNGALTSGGGILLNSRNGWDDNADSTPFSTFVMNGGVISGNIAQKREGGGITLINATGVINGGKILRNKTGYLVDDPETPNTGYGDWGGGGIFVGERAVLRIPTTVLVTGNFSGGFGGGVADCSSGFIFTYNGEDAGVAIFGNKAETLNPNLTGEGTTKPEDHDAINDKVFMENGYNDYYGENFTYVQNLMFNGALENWRGSADGVPVSMSGADDYLVAFERVGLTAYPSGDLPTEAQVVIEGNMSYTHGGGIMANGFSFLGKVTETDAEQGAMLELQATKALMDYTGKVEDLSKYAFKFEVRGADGELVATGTNDKDGNIVFDQMLVFDSANCKEDTTVLTFLITEVNAEYANVKNDPAQYRLTVTVERTVDTLYNLLPTEVDAPVDLEKFTIATYSIESIKLEKKETSDGSWAEAAYKAEQSENGNITLLNLTPDDATFTNTRKTGSLTITKVVDGYYGGETFVFTVTLYNEDGSVAAINGVYDGVTFVNGVAKVEIKGSGSVTITGLPAGLTYKVEEAPVDHYTSADDGDPTGTIPSDGTAAEIFTNTRKVGSLTIKKVVDGNYTGETFVFTVTLYNEDGTVAKINGVYDGITFVDGVAKVEIKGSGSVTITGLPAGLTYKVAETPDDHYTTDAIGETGAIGEGVTAEATFTNHRIPESTPEPEPSTPESSEPSPETGDDSNLFFYLLLMLLSGSVLLAAAQRRKNRKQF